MDLDLDFIGNVIAALAWPVTVIVLALSFRKEIKDKLKNLTSVEAAGAKAAFSEEAKELAADTKQVAVSPVPEASAPVATVTPGPIAQTAPDLGSQPQQPVVEPMAGPTAEALAKHWKSAVFLTRPSVFYGGGAALERPGAIVLDTWQRIEGALALLMNLEPQTGMVALMLQAGPNSWIAYLKERGILSKEASYILQRLYALRNSVAHEKNFEPDMKDALNYVESAEGILEVLHTAANQQSPKPAMGARGGKKD
jgi:hypothetical protein